jgi:hypothetical protein
VKRAFKLSNISIRSEITVFIEIDERLSFAISRACFDAEIGFQHVRRVEWSGNSI